MSDNATQRLPPDGSVQVCALSTTAVVDEKIVEHKSSQDDCVTGFENLTDAGQEHEVVHSSPAADYHQSEAAKASHPQSVIIIQNSGDVNMEQFEPSLLKCVKQVLAGAEGQGSVMIINRSRDSEEPGDEQATYIIDLISLGKHSESSKDCPGISDATDTLVTLDPPQVVRTLANTSPSSFVDNSEEAIVHDSQLPPDIEAESESLTLHDFQEQVEISFVSCPSEMDLNNPSCESDVAVDIVSSQNTAVSEHTPISHGSMLTPGKASGFKNLKRASQFRTSVSTLSSIQTATSLASSDTKSRSSLSSSSVSAASSSISCVPVASLKPETLRAKKSLQRETPASTHDLHQVPAAGTDSQPRRKQLAMEQQTENVRENVGLSDKHASHSVITMYFTSAGEFRETFESLGVPSSAGVMPDGSTSSDSKDTKTFASALDGSCQKTHIHKPGESMPDPCCWLEKCADSAAAAAASTAPSVMSGQVLYRCSECGYCSHNKHYYKQHVDLVHNEDRPYKCPHCDYAGKRRHALLEHLVVHSNQRPFTCDHCNASFRKKGHLTNHIKLHTSQRLIHCGVCNVQLPDSEAFESHLHKIHNTDKLYKCRLCEYTVVDREVMLKHLHEHNEAVMYSCPKCPSLFNNEDSLVHHMKGNHHFSFVRRYSHKPEESVVVPGSLQQPASIICSECGFVCKNTDMMQQHMWIHIKKGAKHNLHLNDKIKMTPVSAEDSLGTLGVLKMNVDLGQKTLPKDVVYQCSSCSFTSSDNSVFIKHMLAHKAQEKRQQQADVSGQLKFPGEDNQVLEAPTNPSAHLSSKPAAYYSGSGSDPQSKPDSGVPFIYDKASARFRCIICGYHCEFQRTIKAHIWKHSGHQSIEYPTFDHPGSIGATMGSPQILTQKEQSKHPEMVNHIGTNLTSDRTPDMSQSQNLPVLVTRSGDAVQLVPVNPLKANYKPGDIIQIKNNTVIIPPECGKNSVVSRFLESIAFSDEFSEGVQTKDTAMLQQSSSDHVTLFAREKQTVSNALDQSGVNKHHEVNHQTSLVSMPLKIDINDQDDTRSSCDLDENCSEPGVVVEVMDTLPSGVGLTGMKSQQGSPRIPDFDGTCSEAKLSRTCRAFGERISSVESDSGFPEDERAALDGADLRTQPPSATDVPGGQQNCPIRMRCPTCDCLLSEDFKAHLLSCQKNSAEDDVKPGQVEGTVKRDCKKQLDPNDEEDLDNPRTEDTDSIESSDEAAGSCTSSGQPKSGICSSLLAVIEQLRERSRSESEEDKLPQISKKGGKKKIRQNDEVDLMSIKDLQNIEKISENGGEKFRCSLCHYSSQRICNIKLHMKTHRQKKPSECSLCDFSSSSPEALQEHMLKHCKVRTYPCKFCPQSFNHKSTLRAHLRAHKDQEPFLCAYCVFETTNPVEYREHMQVHSGCSSRLRCPGCDLILSNKEELTAHLLLCKGRAAKCRLDKMEASGFNSEQDDERSDVKSPLEETSAHHACVVPGCAFFSHNLKELQEHLSIHCNPSSLVCNLCDFKALHSRSLKSHMKRHANDQRYVQQPLEQYKCNLCGYVCHHLPSLKSHMWRHASDQSYSYEFTNDVINAAIDHDTRVDADGEADDPELLDRVINSERKILEGELSKYSRGDGQRPICWVTFRCCSCGFETINKAKLNIHMRSHSDIIQKALDIPRKSGHLQNKSVVSPLPAMKFSSKRSHMAANIPTAPQKRTKKE